MIEELVTAKELCKLLKVSRFWPYKMAKKGEIPCYKMGKAIRFKRSDIEDFLAKSRIEKRGEKNQKP